MAKFSSTVATKNICKALGWHIDKAEQRVPYSNRTRDLFGFADQVAFDPERVGTVYIQSTAGSNGWARLHKICKERTEVVKACLNCGNHIEVWQWKKYKSKGEEPFYDGKRWGVFLEEKELVVRELYTANELWNLHTRGSSATG